MVINHCLGISEILLEYYKAMDYALKAIELIYVFTHGFNLIYVASY